MEVDYYSKYLKYKNKYTELKKQLGSAVTKKKQECSTHDHAYCSTLAIGCHWNGKKCVNNRCLNNDSGSKRGPIDCTATIGCTWTDKECINKKK